VLTGANVSAQQNYRPYNSEYKYIMEERIVVDQSFENQDLGISVGTVHPCVKGEIDFVGTQVVAH